MASKLEQKNNQSISELIEDDILDYINIDISSL